MGHSVDDIWIDVGLGKQFRDVLGTAGCKVKWKAYVGPAQEGHWFREPEELDGIARFFDARM